MTPKARRSRVSRAVLVAAALSMLAGCGGKGGEPTGLRVAVIGLDGATWTLLDPWMREGLLPNLQRIRDEGYSTGLTSVIPPLSAPAWSTAITGVNPGRHGIFDFEKIDRDRFIPVATTSLDRKARAAWEYLTESGRRAVVIGVPLTFPPDSVNGVMISGFPHPIPTGYTFPPSLEQDLSGYLLDDYGEFLPPGGEESLLAQLAATRESRARVALDLYKKGDWDLFWAVFMGTDKMQHFFWKYMDPEKRASLDPALVERYGNALRDFWVRIDAIVGEFVDATDENTVLFVVSDHGFGPIHREMRILRWLWDEKYTALNPLRSRVFYFPHFGGEVTINRVGRFPEGVVKPGKPYEDLIAELRSKLLAVRDPANGKAPIQAVFRADSLYAGPYAGDAPDLLFLPEPGYVFGRGSPFEEGGVFQDPSYTFSAYHEMRGVLLMRGPHVTRGRGAEDQRLLDLTPTVLRVLGETIPVAMDGRPFAGPFDEGFAQAAPLRVGKRSVERTDWSSVAEEMRERLEAIEALPYLQ